MSSVAPPRSAPAAPRVVVADDSALMRRIVTNLLERGGVQVVGGARDGDEALALCERERPDAMTLDLAMPGMGGIEVLQALRAVPGPQLPVIVVSAFSPSQGARAVDALAQGAFDLVSKPSAGEEVSVFEQNLLGKVMAAVAPRRRRSAVAAVVPPTRPARPRSALSRVLVIATSTGGPRALAALLPSLGAPLGLGTLIVQHMPAGFTSSLATRLDRSSSLTVIEAQGNEALEPSRALLAPGGRHLRLTSEARTTLSDAAALGGLRPRADLLIEDAARIYGDRMVLAVLTGMGSDGLAGAKEVRRRGGFILAESEDSCTVYGMPRTIVDAGLADDILPLDRLAAAIVAEVR